MVGRLVAKGVVGLGKRACIRTSKNEDGETGYINLKNQKRQRKAPVTICVENLVKGEGQCRKAPPGRGRKKNNFNKQRQKGNGKGNEREKETHFLGVQKGERTNHQLRH